MCKKICDIKKYIFFTNFILFYNFFYFNNNNELNFSFTLLYIRPTNNGIQYPLFDSPTV